MKVPQSAVIPYRFNKNKLEVLMITSRSGQRWVIPKGLIEPDMTPAQSAANEAWEEAGIKGQVSKEPYGTYKYAKYANWKKKCKVTVFLMQVGREYRTWPEDSFRQREWVPLKEAARRVWEEDLKNLILGLPALVASNV